MVIRLSKWAETFLAILVAADYAKMLDLKFGYLGHWIADVFFNCGDGWSPLLQPHAVPKGGTQ